jgi:hypothetical protein
MVDSQCEQLCRLRALAGLIPKRRDPDQRRQDSRHGLDSQRSLQRLFEPLICAAARRGRIQPGDVAQANERPDDAALIASGAAGTGCKTTPL